MNAVAGTNSVPSRRGLSRGQAVGLMLVSTLLAAIAQILIKTGADALKGATPWAMLTDVPLVAGYALYGVFTVLFVFALRDEELSILYPIISLSYVWVAGLSMWLFHDALNLFKIIGVLIIVAGVAVLGGK